MELYPYQLRWIQDKNRLKIAVKSRRIGYSFADGLEDVLDCIEHPRKNHIILSRGERQAKEFITEAVAPHVRAIGVISSITDSYIPNTSIKTHEVSLSNGSRIIALPANPDTARSYEGDVTLDEFGFHIDARRIYEAIEPSITRGYALKIISTPNGQQGAYYDLAKMVGLVDGHRSTDIWSTHKTGLLEAIGQGCRDRFGNLLDPAVIRASCWDEEMWLQEYMCQFLSLAAQWISTLRGEHLRSTFLKLEAATKLVRQRPLRDFHVAFADRRLFRPSAGITALNPKTRV